MSGSLLKAVAQPVDFERTAQIIPVANPAAGAQWSKVVPGDQAWIVRSVSAVLTTSAVAGNRGLALTADDQTAIFMAAAMPLVVPANLTVTACWARGLATSSAVVTGGVVSAGLPDLVLPPGFRLSSVSTAFDVADQWSAIRLYVESLQVLPFGQRQIEEAGTLAMLLAPYITQ